MSIMFAVAAIAAVQGAPAIDPRPLPRIVVEGIGSVRTPANLAEITYEVDGEGQTSDLAVRSLVSKSAAVENALRSIDAAIDVSSDKVSVQAVRKGECKIDRYEETAHFSTGECAIVGFVATQEYEVRTTKVADAGTMVGLASREGASNPEIEGFTLVDNRQARRQAIAAALADAQSKAEALASGSNARLGELISISLDRAARGEEIIVTGTRVASGNVQDAPVTVLVSPGPVVTTAQVVVTYAIAR